MKRYIENRPDEFRGEFEGLGHHLCESAYISLVMKHIQYGETTLNTDETIRL